MEKRSLVPLRTKLIIHYICILKVVQDVIAKVITVAIGTTESIQKHHNAHLIDKKVSQLKDLFCIRKLFYWIWKTIAASLKNLKIRKY